MKPLNLKPKLRKKNLKSDISKDRKMKYPDRFKTTDPTEKISINPDLSELVIDTSQMASNRRQGKVSPFYLEAEEIAAKRPINMQKWKIDTSNRNNKVFQHSLNQLSK